MPRLSIVFLVGAIVGYTVGYNQGDEGAPSLKRVVLEKVGVYKVRDDHIRRQRAIEAVQQATSDSIESAIHRANAPR